MAQKLNCTVTIYEAFLCAQIGDILITIEFAMAVSGYGALKLCLDATVSTVLID